MSALSHYLKFRLKYVINFNTKPQCRSNYQVCRLCTQLKLTKYRVYLILAGHLLDAGDLPALGVLAPCGAGVDHGVVLELVRRVEDAAAVVRAHHRELAVLHAGLAIQ